MAATIAKCVGYDHSRTKKEQRLGSEAARAEANTWKTFTTCHIAKDGSGFLMVARGTKVIQFDFGPETEKLEVRQA